MKATHRNYMHPRHLRVEENGGVFCYAPSASQYDRLYRESLPDFSRLSREEIQKLLTHPITQDWA